MEFDWHRATRDWTLAERGIDFAEVLIGFLVAERKVAVDDRKDYGETRYNMLASVRGRIFDITYTERGAVTWITSARKANERERRRYEKL
jgi:uncharacterized DUF497 family protein